MRSKSIHAAPRLDRSVLSMRQLLLDNARLTKMCSEHEDVVQRYQLLLREGDHRIKNSLQVVASLLGLQERREQNPSARQALRAASARIRAVAKLHDMMQLKGSAADANIGALIETMCDSLNAIASDPAAIRILVEAEPIHAPFAAAQPIALAVNELVINALRHAFPQHRPGAVKVTVTQVGGQILIVVADDGVGLPEAYGDGHGYGMTLIQAMVANLGGTLLAQNFGGARFTLTLPSAGLDQRTAATGRQDEAALRDAASSALQA